MSPSKNPSSPRSDRRQWQRIFDALVEMVRSQQSQIETLANDRTFLQQYIQIQNDRWSAKARLLESHIAQIKEQEKKGRKVQEATVDLLVGIKRREASRYKKQFEESESDFDDFKAYVEVLLAKIAQLKEKLKSSDSDKLKNGPVCSKTSDISQGNKNATALEELRKLKHAYKNLSSKKELEVSSLLSEKDFVWNQLNKMESDYNSILKAKRIEVEQVNETIQKLQSNLDNLHSLISEKSEIIVKLEGERDRSESDLRRRTQEAKKASHEVEKLQLLVEKLQSSVKEKDQTIEGLKSNLAKFEQNAAGCSNRKSRFFTDQDSQRKRNDDIVTPEGSQPRRASRKHCTEGAEVSRVKKRQGASEGSSVSHVSSSTNGLQQCSRGKRTRPVSPENNSPRLFSSNFKIPKLKNTPSRPSPSGAS